LTEVRGREGIRQKLCLAKRARAKPLSCEGLRSVESYSWRG